MQHTRSKVDMTISHDGARGHNVDFHAYISVNSVSFCAFRVQLNRQFVKEMIIQLVKKEALVIESNQFRTCAPPAIAILSKHDPAVVSVGLTCDLHVG